MAGRKKTQEPEELDQDVLDLEQALEQLKQEFEQLYADDTVECGCGWSGSYSKAQYQEGQMVCPGCGNGFIFEEEMEMATAKTVSKLSDKLFKVGESFTINMYDNGYMIEVSGRNKKTDWVTAKIMVSNADDLVALVREATEMERDN